MVDPTVLASLRTWGGPPERVINSRQNPYEMSAYMPAPTTMLGAAILVE